MDITDGNHTAADRPTRDGAPWTDDDHELLIQGLRDGLADDELANLLGRTPGALKSHARMMLDRDCPREPGERHGLDQLRRLVCDDREYDWESRVRAASAASGFRYWNRGDVAYLHRAWQNAAPLSEPAETLGCSEPQIVRQLIALEYVESTADVVERLGCTPGGVVDLRYRLAVDRANAEVWVLAMSGLVGEPPAHVSIHNSRAEAELARDRVLDNQCALATGGEAMTVSWSVSRRYPGYENSGPLTTGERTISP